MLLKTEITYEVKEMTAGEIVNELKMNKGSVHCMYPYTLFVTKRGLKEETPSHIRDSWNWLQVQRPNLKLYLLRESEIVNNIILGVKDA